MTKPHGKTPSLISGSNGKPSQAVALKQRACTRCEASILKGCTCFEIPQKSGGFSSKKSFCRNCFLAIIKQTQKDLQALQEMVEQTLPAA